MLQAPLQVLQSGPVKQSQLQVLQPWQVPQRMPEHRQRVVLQLQNMSMLRQALRSPLQALQSWRVAQRAR